MLSLNGHRDNTSLDTLDIAANESRILSKSCKCSWHCSIIQPHYLVYFLPSTQKKKFHILAKNYLFSVLNN